MPKSVTVPMRIPTDLDARVRRAAARWGLSMADIYRRGAEAYLAALEASVPKTNPDPKT